MGVDAALVHWLRLLYGRVPPLHDDAEVPALRQGGVHLPPQRRWRDHRAAAAHALAHLAWSPTAFDADGLVPIARVIWATLEDARVEALAVAQWPGLVRLWRPAHAEVSPELGDGFEALLRRLARTLADPTYGDPHPWLRKARALTGLTADPGALQRRSVAELRSAALRLGHDIGQMRLRFNPRTYRPQPDYRDDQAWMWVADALEEAPAAHGPTQGEAEAAPANAAPEGRRFDYPEWDWRIRRSRPAWCTVVEAAPMPPREPPTAGSDLAAPTGELVRPLRRWRERGDDRVRVADSGVPDPRAWLDWWLQRRRGRREEPRVHWRRRPRPVPAMLWLLVDQSMSAGDPAARGPGSRLDVACRLAAALAVAAEAAGLMCRVTAFSSHGRRRIVWRELSPPGEALSLQRALQTLRPDGSTRLGAVLRHATQALARARAPQRAVWLLSDGIAHDIDVHEDAYLVEDARQAVATARRRGVDVLCVAAGEASASPAARRVFGNASVWPVDSAAALRCRLAARR